MNKFILSILMTLSFAGYANADNTLVTGNMTSGKGGKIKLKKAINKNSEV